MRNFTLVLVGMIQSQQLAWAVRDYYVFGSKTYPLHCPATPPSPRGVLKVTGGGENDVSQQQTDSSRSNQTGNGEFASTPKQQQVPNDTKARTGTSFYRNVHGDNKNKNPPTQSSSPRAFGTVSPKRQTLKALQLKQNIKNVSSKVMSTVGPATLAINQLLFQHPTQPISWPVIIALSLLGSASGFYLFLYFITVGYALGIMIPLGTAFACYHLQTETKVPMLTNVHVGLVLAWAIRSLVFFLHREFVNWPELHEKVVQVDKNTRVAAKFFCWITFTGFYVTMILPCILRLQNTTVKWGHVGKVGLVLQGLGLTLETVADYQKSTFKVRNDGQNRNSWCHEGLWKWSTHPNYLGEGMFWLGTYIAGMACFTDNWLMGVLSSIGLLFVFIVLRGAVSTLGAKHLRKYGTMDEFLNFRQSHNIFGPKIQYSMVRSKTVQENELEKPVLSL